LTRPPSRASRGFQIFAKPAGPACNLACRYCYYLEKSRLYEDGPAFRMAGDLLEAYIVQHLQASPDEIVRFSWHGGEPTVLGLEYFRSIVALQKKHRPAGRRIANGLQTNGFLLDDEWGRFLAGEGFSVGLSLDGPKDIHDLYRRTPDGRPTFERTMRGYEILRRHGVSTDIICVVSAGNAGRPGQVYGFFKEIGALYISFLPLVIRRPDLPGGVDPMSVPAEGWGDFLCAIFDEWVDKDIGRIKIQIIEEAVRVAFGQDHSLCIFRPECGDIPVVEHDGGFYSCDHFVDTDLRIGNIRETPLVELLESTTQRAFGRRKKDALPRLCGSCEVLAMCNGECPKNRFVRTADGEAGGNYLCSGYRRFFNRVRPFVEAVSSEWRRQNGLS